MPPTQSTIYVVSIQNQCNEYEAKHFSVMKAFKSVRNAKAYAKRLLRVNHPERGTNWDDYEELAHSGMWMIRAGLVDGDQLQIEVEKVVVGDEVEID